METIVRYKRTVLGQTPQHKVQNSVPSSIFMARTPPGAGVPEGLTEGETLTEADTVDGGAARGGVQAYF